MLCEDKKCVGCLACNAVCPVGAIRVTENKQGFLHPEIDEELCIHCKKCESVCPSMEDAQKKESMGIYAAQHKSDDIRKISSSGGLFGVFAKKVLEDGGVVIGAAFDADHTVRHIAIESEKDLPLLRGSKYVQSDMEECYEKLQAYLKEGRTVLFSGTPCQADAVQKYAGENSGNLITCDLVCHGVPSPKIFEKALRLYEKNYGSRVKSCNFRKKNPNWNMFSMEVEFENGRRHFKTKDTDPYLRGFLDSLFLRPSCYECQYADIQRVSDITIADFWGYVHDNETLKNDNAGISLVMVHSDKGQKLFESVQDEIVYVEKSIEEARKENYCLNQSFAKPKLYEAFWRDYEKEDFEKVCQKYLSVNGKLYLDSLESTEKFDEITLIPSDAVGSKGDEAMIRGALNLFDGKKIHMLTPRRQLWKGWLIDRNNIYTEEYAPLQDLKRFIKQPTHLVIIGADIMDGLYGNEDALTRLDAAEHVIDMGGRADVFSCSFRAEVSEEIVQKIINIGDRLHFHFRDMQSLDNFKSQTGLDAEYFPDLAFFCEKTRTDVSNAAYEKIRHKKEEQYTAVGVNFCEHACKGFYQDPTIGQRKQYVASVVDQIDAALGNRVFYVLIPHDIKHWDGYYSDEAYARWAMEYIVSKHSAEAVILIDNYLTETELLSILPELDMIVSGRMHLDIAAIRSGIVPVGYMGSQTKSYRNTEKFKGMFMERVGRSDLVAGSEEEFATALRIALQEKEIIKQTILEKNQQKTADMILLANHFRGKIGLSELNSNIETIQYRSGNVTETIQYIAGFEDELRIQAEQCARLDALEEENSRQEEHIEQLLQSERDLKNALDAIYHSRTWRLASVFQKMIMAILPPGSKRRLLIKIFTRLVRHPVRSISLLTPSRIRNFFYFLKEEGADFVSNRMDESIQGIAIQGKELDISKLVLDKPFEEYDKLHFKQADKPDVSIIIPVYNQFAYTYYCLQSILKNTGDSVSYEIIVANDCSTDDTVRLHEIAENVRIITNEENLRFLKNCNHAAEYAKGTYILFLNNDTQVQKDWLSPLVQLMESDETVGLTGSKLIYANGRLQEAGGIVWKDGSAWNYGNGSNPANPEFNYVKEADYISGASIMIRASLWKEIGGFDELFVPAYCEDSDLAFEVRKHGYRVVYQPKSEVVHFEGVSNGTDVSSGVKQYQVQNKGKLKKKWRAEFSKQYLNSRDLFSARERGRDKKTVLFIDHYVPHFDQDAGSKTIYQYLQMFIQKGYMVKFIGDNFYQHEPYTSALQQMGIEVLYGTYYARHALDWIRKNQEQIDFVFLNRPHISVKYIDMLRDETNIKIIYYGHDLHFLRNRREYELTGDEKKKEESEEWLKKELYLMRKADISYYPSYVEEEEIHKIDPNIPVKAITAYVYDSFKENIEYDFSKREGILFVGGFGHDPNIDAVLWFVREVWPAIHEKIDAKFYIVGSHATPEIEELDGKDGVVVKGFISDEELEELYAHCKMTVVPLRYGAGVKGKVVEALYNGMPLITTSVGAEGIIGIERAAVIEDDPSEFASLTASLYQDNQKLKALAEQTQILIKERFSTDAVWDIIKDDFNYGG